MGHYLLRCVSASDSGESSRGAQRTAQVRLRTFYPRASPLPRYGTL